MVMQAKVFLLLQFKQTIYIFLTCGSAFFFFHLEFSFFFNK